VVEITELEPSKNRDGATFQVALALNLDEVPVSEEYKLNPINYSTNNKDGYRIVEIKKIEDIILNPKDKELLSSQDKAKPFKATHVVVIASNEKGFPPIQLKMHRKMSDSLKSSYGTFADDENVKSSLTKTFGLEYLVTGFEEAFSRKSNEGNGEYLYFNLTIPISTGSSSAGGWIVAFIVLLIVGFGVFLVLKNKKR
jgi:hypothetical protein